MKNTMKYFRFSDNSGCLLAETFWCSIWKYNQRLYLSPSGYDDNPVRKSVLASLTGVRDRARLLRKREITDRPIRFIKVLPGSYYMKKLLRSLLKVEERRRISLLLQMRLTVPFYGGIKTAKFERVDNNRWRVIFRGETIRVGFWTNLYQWWTSISGTNAEWRQFCSVKESKKFLLIQPTRWILASSQKLQPHPSDAGFLYDITDEGMNRLFLQCSGINGIIPENI